jgi:hypothetical protein
MIHFRKNYLISMEPPNVVYLYPNGYFSKSKVQGLDQNQDQILTKII